MKTIDLYIIEKLKINKDTNEIGFTTNSIRIFVKNIINNDEFFKDKKIMILPHLEDNQLNRLFISFSEKMPKEQLERLSQMIGNKLEKECGIRTTKISPLDKEIIFTF